MTKRGTSRSSQEPPIPEDVRSVAPDAGAPTPVAEFSRPVTVRRLGTEEKTFAIKADEAECAALAGRFGILSVGRLEATIRLASSAGGARVRARGRFAAEVVQTCVVTLEPVASRIEETFELFYSSETRGEEREVVLDMAAEDPPDPIVDGVIDIGEATAEHLALALDPFPRAPGAVFEGGDPDDSPPEGLPGSLSAALAGRNKK